MNKFLIALAATTAIAAAAPAAAQTRSGTNIELRTDQLQAQLQAGIRSGAITRSEAVPLREQLRTLNRLERQYSRGGFTRQERQDLRNRMAHLRHGIRVAARSGGGYDRDDRYDRDGRYDRDCPPGLEKRDNGCLPPGQVGRDDRDGRWGDDDRRSQWIDRNRDGYDDRDLNRDRRIDSYERRMARDRYEDDRDDRWDDDDRDDRRGNARWIDRNRDGIDDRDLNRDGRLSERERRMAGDRDDRWDGNDRDDDRGNRGGILGGIIDQVFGNGGLEVGQRVTAGARLGAVPYEYRSQYRDGNGVYYRADNRAIYQIDARTHTVLRIYGMRR